MSEPVDLTNCDREPIHISGAIQPHGVLIAFGETTGRIEIVSANAADVLGGQVAVGAKIVDVFPEHAAIAASLSQPRPREVPPIRMALANRMWEAIVHRSSGLAVVELEPAQSSVSVSAFYGQVRSAVASLQAMETVSDLYGGIVREVRAITGFDRVMLYRFDRDWHGEVVAEAKRDDLESFFGLHYPASDIPVQARRLYTLNWVRMIVDVGYVPVPLAPQRTPSGAPLDLSFSTLRSVSPIHVEYLRNMGVGASMSVSVVMDGELHALIACHHYSPKFVPFEARSACEFLGQALSFQARAREQAVRAARIAEAKEREAALIGRLATQRAFLDQLLHSDVLALVEAAGFAVSYERELRTFGRTPAPDRLDAICDWLFENQKEPIWSTDRFSEVSEVGKGIEDTASGVVSVALSRDKKAFLLWFRPEVAQTVHWAGDPRKAVQVVDGVSRLSPRGSFKLWVEQTQGRAMPWADWQIEVAGHFRDILFDRIIQHASELASLNRQLEAAARTKDEFLATVSHELRTPLSAITGFASLLKRGLDEQRVKNAAETIERAAKSQARLIDDLLDVGRIVGGKLRLEVAPVDLVSVLESALETVKHAAEAKAIRLDVVVDREAGHVRGDAARLQQVFWNLLTNAVKFTPKGGRVQVTLRRHASSAEVLVSDTGEGVPSEALVSIFERFKQVEEGSKRRHGGLGLGLAIAKHLVELHGGTIGAFSEGTGKGSTFTVRIPIAIADFRADEAPEPASRDSAPAAQLSGKTLLVVDDESDGRALMRTLFEAHGATVHTAGSVEEALGILREHRFDVLVSDVGMPEKDGYDLIRTVRALSPEQGKHLRAVALTAYARAEDRMRALRAGFDAHVAKPVNVAELLAVVDSLLERATPVR